MSKMMRESTANRRINPQYIPAGINFSFRQIFWDAPIWRWVYPLWWKQNEAIGNLNRNIEECQIGTESQRRWLRTKKRLAMPSSWDGLEGVPLTRPSRGFGYLYLKVSLKRPQNGQRDGPEEVGAENERRCQFSRDSESRQRLSTLFGGSMADSACADCCVGRRGDTIWTPHF